MDRAARQPTIRPGSEVYGSDGEKVGKIMSVYPTYIVIEKGFFFPTDYFVPLDAIAGQDGDNVYLNVNAAEAKNRGWDIEPDDTGTSDMSAYAIAEASAGAAAGAGLEDVDRPR